MRWKTWLKLLLGAFVLLIGDIYWETHFPKLNELTVQTDKWPAGKTLNIVQITDVHDQVFGERGERLLEQVREANGDLIVVTGDLIDHTTLDFSYMLDLAEELVKINPNTYFISGNHEWMKIDKPFLQGLAERQVNLLNNESTVFATDDLKINLVGLDDNYTHHDKVEKAFAGVQDKSLYTVVLEHDPALLLEQPDLPGDLILSGHTHGGQIRLPFVGGLVAPGQGWFPTYDKGVYHLESGAVLHVDSGLGTSQIPVRFLNRAQFSLIHVEGTGNYEQTSE